MRRLRLARAAVVVGRLVGDARRAGAGRRRARPSRSNASCSSSASVRTPTSGPPSTKTFTVAGLAPQKLGVSLTTSPSRMTKLSEKWWPSKLQPHVPVGRGFAEDGEEVPQRVAKVAVREVLLAFLEVVLQGEDVARPCRSPTR